MARPTIHNPLTLNTDRTIRQGSYSALADALRRGADLRIGTEFRHNEHIDPSSTSRELVREVAEFRTTYLVDDHWGAGIMTLRQPVDLPDNFGPRPSMSFFLYNQDGHQAIARPYLDGARVSRPPGASEIDDHSSMPRYHQFDNWDKDTNAPSSNFVYDFDEYRFLVNDRWQEILAHSADGTIERGSLSALAHAFAIGSPVKIGILNLCADLVAEEYANLPHEVFVHAGSCYYYTSRNLFITGTHPVVRVRPAIPLSYMTSNWDFGWLMARTDGRVVRWLCNPYTLEFHKSDRQYAIRWFVCH